MRAKASHARQVQCVTGLAALRSVRLTSPDRAECMRTLLSLASLKHLPSDPYRVISTMSA